MGTTVTYENIFASNYSVTGIRQDYAAKGYVVITGSYQTDASKAPQGLVYQGPLYPTNAAGYVYLMPTFAGQTVTSSVFYGPTTYAYDRDIGEGNVRIVGSYKYAQGGDLDHGLMYQGDTAGSGTWTQINVPSNIAGATVANTLCHSTMGDLVVGNYDLAGKAGSGNAFIYNIKKKAYAVLNIGKLATAYGVWRNDTSEGSYYTVAGGYDSGDGLNKGFLFDYDAQTGAITNLTSFSYNNDPGIVTHFEGIMGVPGGYTMAAMGDPGAAFAKIPRNADGIFGAAKWLALAEPNSVGTTTANSVFDDSVIGIYQPAAGGIQSYVAFIGSQQPPFSV